MDKYLDETEVDPGQLIEEIDDYTAFYFTRDTNGRWTLCRREVKDVSSAPQALGLLKLELQEAGVSLDFADFRYVCMIAGANLADLRTSDHPSPDGFTVFFAYSEDGYPVHRWSFGLTRKDDVFSGEQAAEYVRKDYPGALLAAVFAHEIVTLDELQDDPEPTWCTFDGLAPPAPSRVEHHVLFGRRHRQ